MKYYIKSLGHRTEDARQLTGYYEDTEHAAELAAEEFSESCDTETRWPVVFTMVLGTGKEIDVSVEREYNPVFRGTKVKETV
jgi:hypothetical protein